MYLKKIAERFSSAVVRLELKLSNGLVLSGTRHSLPVLEATRALYIKWHRSLPYHCGITGVSPYYSVVTDTPTSIDQLVIPKGCEVVFGGNLRQDSNSEQVQVFYIVNPFWFTWGDLKARILTFFSPGHPFVLYEIKGTKSILKTLDCYRKREEYLHAISIDILNGDILAYQTKTTTVRSNPQMVGETKYFTETKETWHKLTDGKIPERYFNSTSIRVPER